MCGIAGRYHLHRDDPVDPAAVRAMTDTIAHRGPDGDGVHVAGRAGLGHRRLSIIDLSALGAQPMCNEDGSVWIAFNGEIYNYRELREGLLARGHIFRSQTDTEVIIHLYEEHGPACVRRLRGMFALAIWDTRQEQLLLARDRVGIKPLYYARTPRAFLFASEIKALLTDPSVDRAIDPGAIDLFLTFRYLPGTDTLMRDVRKLAPGHLLLLRDGELREEAYWDLDYTARAPWRSIDEAAEALGELLRTTVRDHMVSDVPVGFLASGGVDSTALLSYARDTTSTQIQTFTVGFSGEGFADERPFARLAAKMFDTRHHEISMSADDFRDFLPRYVWHMEEPVCEPPAIALYYVSRLARDHVKVLLSGEGGDEAFGGYPEYKNYALLERIKRPLPGPLRAGLGRLIGLAGRLSGAPRLGKYGVLTRLAMPDYFFSRASSPFDGFNRNKTVLCQPAFLQSLGPRSATRHTRELFERVADQGPLNRMLYVDTKTWLPDDLLVKADKITMATSLELRVPFLDHEVLEFAAALPPEFKVRGRETKRVLKHAFRERVPAEIIHRKKTGFPVPFGRWLNRDLRPFVSDTLLDPAARIRDYLRPEAIPALLHGSREQGGSASDIFSLLVLELWLQRFASSAAPTAPEKAVSLTR